MLRLQQPLLHHPLFLLLLFLLLFRLLFWLLLPLLLLLWLLLLGWCPTCRRFFLQGLFGRQLLQVCLVRLYGRQLLQVVHVKLQQLAQGEGGRGVVTLLLALQAPIMLCTGAIQPTCFILAIKLLLLLQLSA